MKNSYKTETLSVASFTDAWIETHKGLSHPMLILSHLLQMRGLKLPEYQTSPADDMVASFTDAWIETEK